MIEIRHGNIIPDALDCEAIVNAANPPLLGGGGVDGAIHRAAGPQLKEFCRGLPEVKPGIRCRVGEAVWTPAFDLPFKGIIHTVGPMFPGARARVFPGEYQSQNPKSDLRASIRACLQVAEQQGVRKLAFSSISCGVYGCSITTFAMAARNVLREKNWDLDLVVFMVFEEPDYAMFTGTIDVMAGW